MRPLGKDKEKNGPLLSKNAKSNRSFPFGTSQPNNFYQ